MACRPRGVVQSALVFAAAALLGDYCLQGDIKLWPGSQGSGSTTCAILYCTRLCCLQEFVVETRPTGREAEHTEDRTSEVSCRHLSSRHL